MHVSLIAAASENDIIGKEGDLPWHLPKEFQYFKDTTSGHHVIMGRKTFETFPKPLPNRTNIIMTRQEGYQAKGCIVVTSLEEALQIARNNGEEEAFVIGGEQIYRIALPVADRLYLTRVHAEVEGDTQFPDFDESQWDLVKEERVPPDEKNEYAFTYLVYERKR